MISMHDLHNKHVMFQEVKSRPEVLYGAGLDRVTIWLVDVLIAKKPLGGDYCIPLLPFLEVF